jgi:hypothetical protein
VEPKRGISIYGHERWNLNVKYRYMAFRYMTIDRWNLSPRVLASNIVSRKLAMNADRVEYGSVTLLSLVLSIRVML